MGRTAKFTFPVPGRKQKKPLPSPSADLSIPLTKAQKILGTPELNVDTPIHPKDRARFWETRSNSGISISISESTAAFADETGSGRLDDDEVVVHGVSGRHGVWEDESAIIPRGRNGAGSRGGTANDTMTGASSVRQQRSSSTINTYYDKSKVPLSVSQQTASSAMAKGLPAKARALLDVDMSYHVQPNSQKKPSRLDLSYLLPRTMSPKHVTPTDVAPKGLVLGPDLVTRSPSVISVSPDPASPHVHQLGDRRPRKKLTMETLRHHQLEPNSPLERPNLRTASSVNELHNLYEHYEQRSFEEMMGKESGGPSSGTGSPRWESSHPSGPGGREFLSPYSNSVSRTILASRDASKRSSQASGAETPTTSLMTPSSLKSRPADSASISSRHTRTSKASKRTDRSMTDLDLRQNSVLSLSSDSEDDYDDRPSTSVSSAPRRRSGSHPSPGIPDLDSFPRPPSPQAVDTNSVDLPLRRARPVSPNSSAQFAPHEGPASDTGISRPKIAVRTSSLSASSGDHQKAATSHFSLDSTATARPATKGPNAGSARSNGSSREFHPIALIPGPGFRYHRNSQQQGGRRGTRLSTASDQSMPLSPTSVDFYLQSQHNSMAFDSGSIRSGKSMGTIGSASMRSSIASTIVGEDGNGRFIAVTRQEERLLAALRNKRARMRDEMGAEFGEEHGDPTDAEDAPAHHQHRYDQKTLRLLQSDSAPARQRLSSESKRSSGRQPSRNSSLRTVRLASLPEQPYKEQKQLHPPPRAPSTSTLRKISSNASDRDSGTGEQVLLYIRHPLGKMDATDLPEPSPDLDDFGDFDYLGGDIAAAGPTSDTGSGSLSGSAKSQTSSQPREAGLSPAVAAGRNQSAIRGGKTTQRYPSPVSDRDQQARTMGSGHVRLLEDGFAGVRSSTSARYEDEVDVPRPDSPISPAGDLPTPTSQLPKKKQVRLSAVGYRPMEASLWGDDG